MADHNFYYLEEAAKRLSEITNTDVTVSDIEHWAIDNRLHLSASVTNWHVRFWGSGNKPFRFDGLIPLGGSAIKVALEHFRVGGSTYCPDSFPITTSELPPHIQAPRGAEDAVILLPANAQACSVTHDDLIIKHNDLEFFVSDYLDTAPSPHKPDGTDSNSTEPEGCLKNTDQNRFILSGDVWNIVFNGQQTTLTNSVGLRYIHRLLTQKGKEISIVDLYYELNPPAVQADARYSKMSSDQLTAEGLSVSGSGFMEGDNAMSPGQRKNLYERLRELNDLIDEAEEFHDHERKDTLTTEKESITSYITGLHGLSGRPRNGQNAPERIRTNVTQRIRSDIKNKIRKAIPELSEHLNAFINTGKVCIYRPTPEIDWETR